MATQDQIQQALDDLHARYHNVLRALAETLEILEQHQAPQTEPVNEDDLAEAARLMAISDLNKEDLSEAEIYKRLVETSDAEASAVGFWAVPLPIADEPKTTPNKRYTTK